MGDEWSSKRLKRWGLAGTFAALSGVLIWSGADLLVGKTISRFSPQIEKTLSNSLGHPLKIGSYRGLRPWGIELGPTMLLPGMITFNHLWKHYIHGWTYLIRVTIKQ